jgi:hypothetical protein
MNVLKSVILMPKQVNKNPKEACNSSHSIMKMSVTPEKADKK